jgi:chromosome segregation ATPase
MLTSSTEVQTDIVAARSHDDLIAGAFTEAMSDQLKRLERQLASSQIDCQNALAERDAALSRAEELRDKLRSANASADERLARKEQQLEARRRLVEEQAAVIEKLKLPVLDLTAALQGLQVRAAREVWAKEKREEAGASPHRITFF